MKGWPKLFFHTKTYFDFLLTSFTLAIRDSIAVLMTSTHLGYHEVHTLFVSDRNILIGLIHIHPRENKKKKNNRNIISKILIFLVVGKFSIFGCASSNLGA